MLVGVRISVLLGVCGVLAACNANPNAEVDRALGDLGTLDEANLSQVMLTVADPDEAVAFFRNATGREPDRIDFQRGLATSLIRAGRATEGAVVWERVVVHPEATNTDQVEFADALIRVSEWDRAEQVLDSIPPTFENHDRYRLEAMIADSNEEWERADSFYETAASLTTTPAGVLNNWGFSRLTRGDFDGAQRLFAEAITYDPGLFTAKNNLVLARAAQGNYDLPLVPMTQVERAELLHTAALAAIRRGEVDVGRNLLSRAIDTHPQFFEAATRALRQLEENALN